MNQNDDFRDYIGERILMKDFEELLREYGKSAETYVRYKISSSQDAEDILQETYVRAFSSFDSLNSEESFRPWLISIARNKVNDYYRKKAEMEEVPYDDAVIQYVDVNRSVNNTVSETMKRLTDRERELLHLYYWEDMSVEQIAGELKIPEGPVKSRLYKARKSFEKKYPQEELKMKRLPERIFDYQINELSDKPFETRWNELMGWFLIPEEGNSIRWGIYDYPERTLTEQFDMKCSGKMQIHGITGVKVTAIEKQGREKMERHFVAQLTDTHCRYLAESHMEDGIEKMFTFLDGEAFLNNWGFGPENIGNETNLKMKGLIKREGNSVIAPADRETMDVVGRYEVVINGKSYDTVCLMDIGTYDENTVTEQYIDRSGRTVLWRRFNKNNTRWNYDHFEEVDEEELKDNETINVNGKTCYHWYDCITDYIL